MMRINIVLDDLLIQEAFRYTHVKTTKELLEQCLRELIKNNHKHDIRELENQITPNPEYDYKKLRRGE